MIHVLTDAGAGGTFLTWSIHFLAGHTEYFCLEKNQTISLVDNPIGKINAHNFLPNQPNRIFNCSKSQFLDFTETLCNSTTSNFHVLYYHTFLNQSTTPQAVSYSNQHSEKLIVVDTSDFKLYHCCYRKRSPVPISTNDGKNILLTNNQDIQNHFIQKYFKDSKNVWNELGLQNIWDLREFIALNFDFYDTDHIYEQVDKTRDHHLINGAELWTSFDFGVESLLQYLDINIDSKRLNHWQQIYNQWRTLHQQRLMFAIYFETIINSIVNNYNLDLIKFDLDIEQEAAIQNALIHRHNLNLKTWQLEKFVNTKQLHSLLEPNIHPL